MRSGRGDRAGRSPARIDLEDRVLLLENVGDVIHLFGVVKYMRSGLWERRRPRTVCVLTLRERSLRGLCGGLRMHGGCLLDLMAEGSETRVLACSAASLVMAGSTEDDAEYRESKEDGGNDQKHPEDAVHDIPLNVRTFETDEGTEWSPSAPSSGVNR